LIIFKDVAIVFITANSGEGYITVGGNVGDRNDLNAWNGGVDKNSHLVILLLTVHLQDALVTRVASSNSRTIVVINSVGPIVTEAWVNNPNGR
jgi:beta-glucosidase